MQDQNKTLSINLGVSLNKYCYQDSKSYPVTVADLKNFIHTLATFGIDDDAELDDCDIYISVNVNLDKVSNLQNTLSSSYTIYSQQRVVDSQ